MADYELNDNDKAVLTLLNSPHRTWWTYSEICQQLRHIDTTSLWGVIDVLVGIEYVRFQEGIGYRAIPRAALAQTASESATGDVDLSTMLDDVDGVMPDINSLPERLAVAEDEIEHLTRELSAATAKIESALAIEAKNDEWGYQHGYNDARDEFRKRLTTDD